MIDTKRLLRGALVCACLVSGSSAFAQDEVGGLIKSTPEDAMKLAQAYLNPLFKGFGIGLNSGWNNTGRAKNTARFELRVGFTGAFVPDADKTFDVTQLGLSSNIRPVNPSQTLSPTVGGSSSNGVRMGIYNQNYQNGTTPLETFDLPEGADLPFIPAPQLQATVGLPKGIDVTLRAMPNVDLGDAGTIGMIGGGVKVDLLPLLLNKTADRLIPVDLGLAVGYTQFTYKLPLDVPPPSGAAQDPDQEIDAKFSGFNAEAILSKNLIFFSPFVSVGYNTAESDARLRGRYEFTSGATPAGPTYTSVTDPIRIKNNEINGLRANVGFQLKLAVFRVYASYSLAEYNAFNAGIGLGLGK